MNTIEYPPTPEDPQGRIEHRIYGGPDALEKARQGASEALNAGASSVKTTAVNSPYEPCPCGSGKKFKFCHGATAIQRERQELSDLVAARREMEKTHG